MLRVVMWIVAGLVICSWEQRSGRAWPEGRRKASGWRTEAKDGVYEGQHKGGAGQTGPRRGCVRQGHRSK